MKNSNNLNPTIIHELNGVIDTIKQKVSIEKLYLFGSYAYGTPEKDSDIDICLITNDQRRKLDLIRIVQSAIYGVAKHSFDILVYRPDEFLYRSNSVTTIEKTIAEKGVIIYE